MKRLCACFMRFVHRIGGWFRPYLVHPDYIAAAQWQHDRRPTEADSDTIELAIAFAKEKYNESCESFESLDNKADALLRLTGGAGVAFSVASHFAGSDRIAEILWPLGFFIAAALFALVARWPRKKASPPRVNDLLDDLNDFSTGEIKQSLAGAYYCSAVGVQIAADAKADLIVVASGCICAGLIALAAAIL